MKLGDSVSSRGRPGVVALLFAFPKRVSLAFAGEFVGDFNPERESDGYSKATIQRSDFGDERARGFAPNVLRRGDR
jgi:hypothetical protein